MIERGLQDIVALRGVASVLLVEEDGFVVYRTDSEDSDDALHISKWLETVSYTHLTLPTKRIV